MFVHTCKLIPKGILNLSNKLMFCLYRSLRMPWVESIAYVKLITEEVSVIIPKSFKKKKKNKIREIEKCAEFLPAGLIQMVQISMLAHTDSLPHADA